jgi:hypothetical protein
MQSENAETISNVFTTMQAYIERRVTKEPQLPPEQKKSIENDERVKMCEAFAELVDSRIEGRLTDELWESWDEMQREQMEDNRQNLSFMNSLIKLIDRFKQQSV